MNKEVIIVGGNFGNTPKKSSVINVIASKLECDCINGGSIEDIKNIDLSGYKIIIWAPNIDNSFEKIYPKKDTGSILICSKNLRDNRNVIDAIGRIFKMHGNAVIAINSNVRPFVFKFVDALGNVWVETSDVDELCETIGKFSEWTTSSIRMRCVEVDEVTFNFSEYQEFIEINRQVADKFEKIKGRYFGNTSTRCAKMFPTIKIDKTHMIVSRRNVSKERITTEDLVMTTFSDEINNVEYYGKNKPSVDTPIQLSLYNMFPDINYMIHGHTYIDGAKYSKHYFPCGDMREVDSAAEIIRENNVKNGAINLINHGFLIYADTIEKLREIVDNIEFYEREVGFEKVHFNQLKELKA